MSKLRLDLEDISVETFGASEKDGEEGTVAGFQYDTFPPCTSLDYLCSADCTGLGVMCFTQDPIYFPCTGANPCTEDRLCTNGCPG